MAVFGVLGCVTSLLLMAAVAWMNYRFFLRLAPDEGQIPALGSIAVEILLACFSPLIGWGWAQQRRLFAMVVTAAVTLFAAPPPQLAIQSSLSRQRGVSMMARVRSTGCSV